jgi:dTDP-4-dehydrorhamnose 3,5-epimerase/reductase
MADLRIEPTPVPGLLVVHLPVHSDNRGWFKENWQRESMIELGLPDFAPVQNNVSYNGRRGTTRGIHAEPWDKMVSVVTGRIFGAWVDLREGETFGQVFTLELGPETAVFVPRGVGNSYQTLEDATSYSYLVNDHWSPEARSSYTFVNLADPALAISWPISLEDSDVSAADREHPFLYQVQPFRPRKSLILGAGGQVGATLSRLLPEADALTRSDLDLAAPGLDDALDWESYDVVYNAAAYTAVDEAETPEGRRKAWAVNATGVARLVRIASRHRLMLVHFSTDYVFDGTRDLHDEGEPFSPLGVYGQSKAAGDALVSTLARHFLIRTSWVIGEGKNFISTMASLADRGVSPAVVDDQCGRLSFADDIARAAVHLTTCGARSGTYNVTSSGDPVTWADLAVTVFRARGREASAVSPVSTEEYAAGKHVAPRPRHSTLDLSKVVSTGFVPRDGSEALAAYLAEG